MSEQQTPPGWYRQADGRQRYWDGQQWTEHVEPSHAAHEPSLTPMVSTPQEAHPQPGSQGKPKSSKNLAIVLSIVAVVAIVLFGLIGWAFTRMLTDEPTVEHAPQEEATTSAEADDGDGQSGEAQEGETEKDDTTDDGSDPADPELLDRINAYLASTGVSKQALLHQLERDGYERDQIEQAVESVDVDWDYQALKRAESYLRYRPYSVKGVEKQLEFEGFTDDEITYALDNVDADWKENAVNAAEELAEIFDDPEEVWRALKADEFTSQEIEYAKENADV